MKRWYEELFKNYAETYDREPFTQGTPGEVDFIEREISGKKSCRILDIGCGTGRHAIELAQRGYQVTGIDLSASQLKRARAKARLAGVSVRFLRRDARRPAFRKKFGLVLMICEGAFPLMETDEMNFAILKNAALALQEKGKLILTTLNALFPLAHSTKDFLNANLAEGSSKGHKFDLMTFREKSTLRVKGDDDRQKTLRCDERCYAPSEMAWLLKSLGFKKVDIFSCRLGRFSRRHRLTPHDLEMLVVAEK